MSFKIGDRVKVTAVCSFQDCEGVVKTVNTGNTACNVEIDYEPPTCVPSGAYKGKVWYFDFTELTACAPRHPSNLATPAKFNKDDEVEFMLMANKIRGRIKCTYVTNSGSIHPHYTYDVVNGGATFGPVPEHELVLVQRDPVPPIKVEPGNAQTSNGLAVQQVPPVQPQCPACGTRSQFNYVGFTTIECVKHGCIHHSPKARQKLYEEVMANGKIV